MSSAATANLNPMPLFSVVTPVFNRMELLRETLDSILRQRFTDFEILVVDDGSSDGSAAAARGFGNKVRVLEQANGGPGVARNLGCHHARGRYVAFLDSDDLWFPWTLETFATLISRHQYPAILSARLVEFSDPAELAELKAGGIRACAFPDYYASHGTGYFVGAGMAVLRRDAFLAAGGFTDRRINAEDHDLILRMGTMPGFVQVLAPITLGWRRHSGSATRNVGRTFEGMCYLAEQERGGRYPGGCARALERRRILSSHARSASLECVSRGLRHEAWQLYRETLRWHLQLGRWKYLSGFPLKALMVRP
jgi:GT2 family glycosyltransferase